MSTSRPTLYLLHGLLCDARVWDVQRASLARDYDVRIPSLRGYDSFAAMAAAVLADAPERFLVAGHSMGGRVALEVFQLDGARLDGLALLDTGVHPAGAGEQAQRQVLIDLAHERGMRVLARQWAAPMVHPARLDDAPLMNEIHDMVATYDQADYEGQVRALLGRRDAAPLLGAIACPTLVLCGSHDGWSPVAQHEAIAAAIPGAVLEVIPDCGHMATMERPREVADALRRWLATTR